MKLIELQQGRPLEQLIPDLMGRFDTVKEMADSINVGEATLWRWMTLLGLRTKHMEDKEWHRQERESRNNP